jgi:hypothetical protein
MDNFWPNTLIFGGFDEECIPAHQIDHTDALCIFAADQERGNELFKTSPAVQETEAQLKYISIDYDMDMLRDEGSKQSLLKCIVLQFKSKFEAKRARRRIVEEQHGGQWLPFAVSFAVV